MARNIENSGGWLKRQLVIPAWTAVAALIILPLLGPWAPWSFGYLQYDPSNI